MRSRLRLFPLALGVFGMLLLSLAAYIGLGWALWRYSASARDVLGKKRADRLIAAYARVLAGVFPKDSDGDGFADAVEIYFDASPYTSNNHPDVDFWADDPGFEAWTVDGGRGLAASTSIQLQPGERRRIYARAGIFHERAVFAPGMELELQSYGLLALPDGEPSNAPLMVPVAADGAVAFDLVAPREMDFAHPVTKVFVLAIHARSRNAARSIAFTVAHRRPSLVPKVEAVERHVVRLSWPAVVWPGDGPPGSITIEATRDESGENWFAFAECEPAATHCTIAFRLSDSPARFRGPMKFRVVPTQSSPPEP